MTHPNIVKYYKTFLEGKQYPNSFDVKCIQYQSDIRISVFQFALLCSIGDRLYIIMELIEGVPLAIHFNSLKEKQQQIIEERVWNIFIQVTKYTQ